MSDKLISVLAQIEELRTEKAVSNEQAALASYVIEKLTDQDEALLANRLVHCGSDPASLQLALDGSVSEPIRRAHAQGPGALAEGERQDWLLLASQSLGEEGLDMTVHAKVLQFMAAVRFLQTATVGEKADAVEGELAKIKALPYVTQTIGGVAMRHYTSDRGFAAAYWSGESFAAVQQGELTFVGCTGEATLESIGCTVDKPLGPQFGLIFAKENVSA